MSEYNGVKGEWRQVTRDNEVNTGDILRIVGPWTGGSIKNIIYGLSNWQFTDGDVIEKFVPEFSLDKYKPGTVLLGAHYQRAIVRSEQSWHWADDDTDSLEDETVARYLDDGGYRAVKTPV